MAFVQYGHLTDLEREQQRYQVQLAGWIKELEQMQGVIRIKLEIASRGGLNAAMRQEISEAAEAYGDAFDKILNACPKCVEKLQIGRKK